MKKLILAGMLLALVGCSDNEGAVKALSAMGYTNIKTHGWSAFGCAQSDDYSTQFTATGVNGKPVKGVACRGVFKGTTIRTE